MDSIEKYSNSFEQEYDRVKEVKAFDESKMGVKGLVDSGAKTIPRMFIRPPDEIIRDSKTPCVKRQLPVIDLQGIGNGRKKKESEDEIVKQVLEASENWGFFQVVNHGIPVELLDKMVKGVKMFHEQDVEAKKEFYTRDLSRQVVFNTNYDLYSSSAANWRDTLAVHTIYTGFFDPQALPDICRDVMREYINHILKLSDILLELLSMALGLEPDRLKETECSKGWSLVNHYYPACPAPELTLGTSQHSDATLITILLQDQIGGLQVLHQNQWVDVHPIPGAFVVNIGDILQMLSNDKFKSVHHRVTANHIGPRVSVGFLLKGLLSSPKLCGPIKELLSEDNPPLYREFTLNEVQAQFFSRSLDDPSLGIFKLQHHGDGK